MAIAQQPGTASPEKLGEDAANRSLGLAGAGFIALMAVIAYEWTFSGLTKLARGGFPSGLAGALHDMGKDTPGWYARFLDGAVLPHAQIFGVLIEAGELAIGLTFFSAALLAATRWRLSDRARTATLSAVLAAALGGAFLALNFHLAMGANAPWQMPKDGFDESVDLDSLLVAAQLVIAVISARALVRGGAGRLAVAVVAGMVVVGVIGLSAASLSDAKGEAGTNAQAPGRSASSSLRRAGPGPIAATMAAGGYTITLRDPNSLSGGGSLAVRLTKNGKPVSGARVQLTFSMESMGMGAASALRPAGPGMYTTKAPALNTPGEWLIGIAIRPPRAAPVAAVLADAVEQHRAP